MRPTLEVCVDTAAGLRTCAEEGVDRVELCSALSVGGLTPSLGMMKLAAQLPVDAHVMIRPRDGDFIFSADEVAMMCADIQCARDLGLSGVVLGAVRPDGGLDENTLRQLITVAGPMSLTLHRVVDTLTDPSEAIDIAIGLGFNRILTSGGAKTAAEGKAMIARMNRLANGRIEIMAGSGVTPQNLPEIAAAGIIHFHASCRDTQKNSDAISKLGFGADQQPDTSAARIRAMKDALNQLLNEVI